MWDRRYLVGRTERYRASLLDKNEKPLHIDLDLDPKNGGKLDFRSLADIRVSGSLNAISKKRIDLLDKRIQLDYIFTPNGYEEETWHLARLIPIVPKENWDNGQLTVGIEVYDKTYLLNTPITQTYTVPAGANLRSHVISLIQSIGETNINIPASILLASKDMVYKAGQKKRVVINDILSAMGFWAIRCDGQGQWISNRYVKAEDRPVVHAYTQGRNAIYLPRFTLEKDYYNIPNQVIGTMAVEGATEAPMYAAENHNPLSPFSIESRGVIVPKVLDSPVDAADETIFHDKVETALAAASQVAGVISLNVLWTPLDLNDVIEFNHEQSETVGKYTAANFSISVTPRTLTQLEVKEVIST